MANTKHVKVALTTDSLTDVDADFANAKQILFYDVSAEEVRFLDAMQFDGRPPGERGPGGGQGCSNADPTDGAATESMDAKIFSLRGCGVLFTKRLSDFAAVRIHNGHTFPVKMEKNRDVAHVLNHLQKLITGKTPRWLEKKLRLDEGIFAI